MDPARTDLVGYRTRCDEPLAFVPTERAADSSLYLSKAAADGVVLDVIHDGDVIPEAFLHNSRGEHLREEAFIEYYEKERDWGAGLVAAEIAKNLGLPGFFNVQLARVLLDFGRFPGSTTKNADFLARRAINFPFSEHLSHGQKRDLLERYYDRISSQLERVVEGARLKIAIHTYDTFNATGTRRPPVSILTRCLSYQTASEMPIGVFDPMYPDILGQFTCDRILRDRISLTLERADVAVEHNYPYLLPDGSVEVRSQVWNFFTILRAAYEKEFPQTASQEGHQMVWNMLLDTNLRSAASEELRSYLHVYRRVHDDEKQVFSDARDAYEDIKRFLQRDGGLFVERYRRAKNRPSALAIEVRKDRVWRFDKHGRPLGPRLKGAQRIGRLIAQALHTYFTEDRSE